MIFYEELNLQDVSLSMFDIHKLIKQLPSHLNLFVLHLTSAVPGISDEAILVLLLMIDRSLEGYHRLQVRNPGASLLPLGRPFHASFSGVFNTVKNTLQGEALSFHALITEACQKHA